MSSPDDQNLEFTVVKGSPTEEELAAVVTVLTTQFSQPRPRRRDTSSVRLVGVLAISAQPPPARSYCLANVWTAAIVSLRTNR